MVSLRISSIPCHAMPCRKKGVRQNELILTNFDERHFYAEFYHFHNWIVTGRYRHHTELVVCAMPCRTTKIVRQNELYLTNFDELWRIDECWYRFRNRWVINPTKFVTFRTDDESMHFDVVSCRKKIVRHHSSKWRTITTWSWKTMTN